MKTTYPYKSEKKTHSQSLPTESENTHTTTYRNTACKFLKNCSYISIQQRETLCMSLRPPLETSFLNKLTSLNSEKYVVELFQGIRKNRLET